MTDQIIPFNFDGEQVRVVTVDGEPWFVLADLARVLRIVDVQRLNSRLEDGVRQTHPIADRLGRIQHATIVSEAGMYEVVIRSDKPEAATFRRWITGTVLPEIRKTGSYGTLTPQGPELLALAVLAANQMLAEKDATIAELAPKADYVDTFVADSDLRILRNVAKSIGMQESHLRSELISRKWIYREESTRWSEKEQKVVQHDRYSAYSDKTRYFTPVPNHEAPRFRGEVMHTLKVTPLGAEAIARNFKQVAA